MNISLFLPPMKRVAFIVNGNKKLTKSAQLCLIDCLASPIFESHVFHTTGPSTAVDISKKCAKDAFDVVIAVGGDGTANEVLNGLFQAHEKLPVFGLLPSGTGNDFVRSLDHGHDFYNLRTYIENETYSPLDVIEIETTQQKWYALNIVDIGFGGKVIQLLNQQRKLIGGKISYSLAILRTFSRYKAPTLKIETQQLEFSGKTFMLACCNGHTFGNGLCIHPSAKLNSGKLHLTLLGNISLKDYLLNLSKLKKKQHIQHPEVHYFEAEKLSISILSGNAFAEMDGEVVPDSILQLTCIANQLRFLGHIS